MKSAQRCAHICSSICISDHADAYSRDQRAGLSAALFEDFITARESLARSCECIRLSATGAIERKRGRKNDRLADQSTDRPYDHKIDRA